MDDKKIETARRFSRHSHGVSAQIKKLRQDLLFSPGVLPVKAKLMSAVLWSVSVKCEPCIDYYVSESKKNGVTEEEIGELMAVATVLGACVAETWGMKAFSAFTDELSAEASPGESSGGCCR